MRDDYPTDSFLGRLSRESVDALTANARSRVYERGQIVIGERDPSRDLYLVFSGSVRAASFTKHGREIAFNDILAGDCFGEIAAIDGGPRSSSVMVTETAEIARIPQHRVRALLTENNELCQVFLALFCEKLRALSTRMVELTGLKTSQRLRRELARLARAHRTGPDSGVILKPPTQTDLAIRIFARREEVSREMSRLRKTGLIVKEGRTLRAPSIQRLEADEAD